MEMLSISDLHAAPAVLQAYENVLGAMRGADFEASVIENFRAALSWERLYIFEGAWDQDATLRVASYEPNLETMVALYRRDYMRSDPLHRAVATLRGDTGTLVLRLEPADIPDESYRRVFFEECGIIERISVLQRSERSWRGINIARHRRAGPCSRDDLSVLAGLGQLILPLVNRHFAPPPNPQESLAGTERRFALRFPELTDRERQVCARAALGMSVEATALDLEIGRASVLTYRRRAYGRLHVTSPYELAALVLH